MPVPVEPLLRDAARRLEIAGVPTPEIDASALLTAAARSRTAATDTVSDEAARLYEQMIQRRQRREPVSHIKGTRAFWNHDFIVTRDVLDPRPDTETLVELALHHPFERVLDLGTGSGCILLSLMAETGACGVGVDISDAALEVARHNAAAIGVTPTLLKSDWFSGVDGTFDLIVANPPYVTADGYLTLEPEVQTWEPRIAVTPGGDGLDPYRIIADQLGSYLSPLGRVLVEIGYDQGDAVSGIFEAAGLRNISVHRDLGGKDRVVQTRSHAQSAADG
ncbi:peptide chain release factor N(5)-glutamine methyltransferase [Litoreibacter roseus]|uniref:Release factor glutamine methyltransferase n=1 Tax=Litoreibacter roseus TaxID=2601869 RepID=A0A6N6JFI7_9RHOB|nr:peptide chain release factor N(5)-glutamine methyltransferase [Litoreibacter roseus]GFE64048.1 release factor glutamine methyltransferase [Litoreibacter roseus]